MIMPLRIVNRVITFNPTKEAIILVRNKDMDYWYPPGGGWEVGEGEALSEGACREVLEECGVEIQLGNLIYVQEFHEGKKIGLELFWLAMTTEDISADHCDMDPYGQVEEVRWVTQLEMQEMKVYPRRLKDLLWQEREIIESLENQYMLERI